MIEFRLYKFAQLTADMTSYAYDQTDQAPAKVNSVSLKTSFKTPQVNPQCRVA